MLFNILLNDNLRNAYNRFYKIKGFADPDSKEPKKYGIAYIMDTNYDTEDDTSDANHDTKSTENVKHDNIGGKKIKKSRKSKKSRTRKPRKTKKNRKTKSKKNKNLK